MTCCERLHASANIAQQETTLLGSTMLHVVASVCTGLKSLSFVFLLIWSENTWHTNGRYVDLEETEASEREEG